MKLTLTLKLLTTLLQVPLAYSIAECDTTAAE
jgi:hypothetical protein